MRQQKWRYDMVLTEKGFQRPTYDDLLAAQVARAKKLFGEDIY